MQKVHPTKEVFEVLNAMTGCGSSAVYELNFAPVNSPLMQQSRSLKNQAAVYMAEFPLYIFSG